MSWGRYLHFAALGKRKRVGRKNRPKLTRARVRRMVRDLRHVPRGAEPR